MSLKELLAAYKAKSDRAAAIKAMTDEELTDEVIAEATALPGELRDLKTKIDAAQAARTAVKSAALESQAFAQAPSLPVPHAPALPESSPRIDPVSDEVDRVRRNGSFASAGHFYKAIFQHGLGQVDAWASESLARWDQCVKAVMTTLVDPSAGILVPEGFSTQIEKRMNVTANLMTRARVLPISGSSMKFLRRKDASRADGSRHAGVTCAYVGEGKDIARTTASYEGYRIEASKLACLVELTEELISDSPQALEAEVEELAADAIVYTASNKMFRGTGAGCPKGILESGCLVTVAKESGQAAKTLDHRNITKMWMYLDPESRSNAIWMINNDVSDELDNLAFPVGTGGVPSYLPAGGLSQTGFASLKGRPVIPFEYCSTLGTVGDIVLADWSQYRGVTKTTGIQTAMSLHVAFERDSRVYRFTHRFGGQPIWNVPFTAPNSAVKTSAFVALAARA